MRLIFATNNDHKLNEFKNILEQLNFDIVNNKICSLSDFEIHIDPEENGNTYEENANIKSIAAYDELSKNNILKVGDFIISDDTGLSIDFFDGKPGIYSARFMGDVSQTEKNKKILEDMKDATGSKRNAHFDTVLSVIEIKSINDLKNIPSTNIFKGRVEGYISDSIYGSEGFGYDPIFAVGDASDIEKNQVNTYASMGQEVKNKISHRAKAVNCFVLYLEKYHNI